METNRVILANEPRLLRGMLRRVIGRVPSVKVVGEVTDLAELPSLVSQSDAQWVIVSLWPEGRVSSVIESLLTEHSSLCILGVAADCSRAKVMCKDATEEVGDGLSSDDLIGILQRRR